MTPQEIQSTYEMIDTTKELVTVTLECGKEKDKDNALEHISRFLDAIRLDFWRAVNG